MTGDQILGLIMLFGMITVIFVGFPISFTLLFLGLVFGAIGLGAELTFNLAYIQIWGTMKDEVFPAVPLFIFMGFMTEQAGLMERLFAALRNLLAPVRGSLYLAVILTATIFAMATGIVGAAVTVLGIMAAPMMIKAGYDARLSSGAIAAGGTLGILIPPSVMLVVMGPTMGVPVNLLYSAAFGPGFLLAAHVYHLYARPQLHQSQPRAAGAEGRPDQRPARGDPGGRRRRPAAGAPDRFHPRHDPGRHGDAHRGGGLRRDRRHLAGAAATASCRSRC